MKSFFIHTATPTTTIALFEGNQVVQERRWPSQQDESERLMPAVDDLLKAHDLTNREVDQLICCVGPGGFTSVRVGVSAVNAWAFARGIKVATVSVFDLFPGNQDLVVITANPKEAWVQMNDEEAVLVHQESLSSSLELPEGFRFTGLVNQEWREVLEALGGCYEEQQEELPELEGLTFSPELIKPWYYKDPNITWSERVHGKQDA